MKILKNNILSKIFIAINFITILISAYKIVYFISGVGGDLFEWWLPMGKVFSYIHYWIFVTFFIIPLPFGFYFLILLFYFLASAFLIFKIKEKTYNLRQLFYSIALLLGVLGTFIIFIGE